MTSHLNIVGSPQPTLRTDWEVLVAQSSPTLCNPMDCQPTRLLFPRNSPGKNTGVGSLSLLHRIFPTQGANPVLLNCRWILYHWATWEAQIRSKSLSAHETSSVLRIQAQEPNRQHTEVPKRRELEMDSGPSCLSRISWAGVLFCQEEYLCGQHSSGRKGLWPTNLEWW